MREDFNRSQLSLFAVFASELTILAIVRLPQNLYFGSFAFCDPGSNLTLRFLVAHGYRPAVDFGYPYGLLPDPGRADSVCAFRRDAVGLCGGESDRRFDNRVGARGGCSAAAVRRNRPRDRSRRAGLRGPGDVSGAGAGARSGAALLRAR